MKIGILGGGQLGRMLALAGVPFGHQFRFWEPTTDSPASDLGEIICGDFGDSSLVEPFIAGLDCISYEFENIPTSLANELASRALLFPSPRSLEISQDRLSEKTTFQELGLGCAAFCPIDSAQSRIDENFKFPAILKTRRMGYDGKGQASLNSATELAQAWNSVGAAPSILEERISFEAEFSLICVRGRSGEKCFYPLVENRHRNGILASSRVPSALVTDALQKQAEEYGTKLLEHLDHVGVLTIEFFATKKGLLINEIAPRVHNSGHWSIEGAQTSQFENHIRAITGAPLGATALKGTSVLLNLVGNTPPTGEIEKHPSAHLHLYRKAPRPRRKIGHVTLNFPDDRQVEKDEQALTPLLEPFLNF